MPNCVQKNEKRTLTGVLRGRARHAIRYSDAVVHEISSRNFR